MTRENELMQQAVNKWGEESQLKMVVEECAELIVAIQHKGRGRVGWQAVIEEGVDVELCIEQLKLMAGNNPLWQKIREEKLNRLERLLNT